MFGDLTVKVKMEPSKRYKLYLKSHMLLTIVFLLMLPYEERLIDRVKNGPQMTSIDLYIFTYK